MMESDRIVIVGAGIAGCGLCFNLRKQGYRGEIILMDPKGIGGGIKSYRNTFPEVVEEYNFPWVKKFEGIKIGAYDKVFMNIEIEFYLLEYMEICKYLLEDKKIIFRKEKALNFMGRNLYTNRGSYRFDYLIDCSGIAFFGRKKLKMKLPFRYWLGKVKEFACSKQENQDFYYHMFSNENYLEDYYPRGNKVTQGDWHFSKEINFELIQPHDKRILEKNKAHLEKEGEYGCAIPCTPVFPMTTGRIAFLGDSFGNASTSSAEGIRPILASSKILAKAILLKDLKNFEIEWKKKYFSIYYKYLAMRMDLYSDNEIIKRFKYPKYSRFLEEMGNHKDVILKRLRGEDYKLPKKIKKMFPLYALIFRQLVLRIYLNLIYRRMR